MTINQLFMTRPSDEVVDKFIKILGYKDIYNIDEEKTFTKTDLEKENVKDKFILISDDLKKKLFTL